MDAGRELGVDGKEQCPCPVVVVDPHHKLAPLPRLRESDPAWSAYWRVDPRLNGRPAPDGPLIDAIEDKFELVAAGQAVAIFLGHNIQALRPDLTSIPLDGVDPAHVVLATRADDHSRLVAAFRKYARTHLGRPDSAEPTPS